MILALNYIKIKTCYKESFLMFNANSAIRDLCYSNTILQRGVSGRFSFLCYIGGFVALIVGFLV